MVCPPSAPDCVRQCRERSRPPLQRSCRLSSATHKFQSWHALSGRRRISQNAANGWSSAMQGVTAERSSVRLADFLWSAGYWQSRRDLRPKIARARHHELLDFYLLERLLAAEQMRNQGDLRKVLHGFHLHVGMFERVAVGYDTMIRHQNRVVIRNVRFQRLRQF